MYSKHSSYSLESPISYSSHFKLNGCAHVVRVCNCDFGVRGQEKRQARKCRKMRRGIYAICKMAQVKTISLNLVGGIYSARADVIHLNADTFTDKVKEKDTLWFVQFCVPWCKHCKKIYSLWDEFGKAAEGEDSVEIAQVDCSTSKPVCSKVDIHSYPTFKLFYNGEEYEKYTGPRDVESLKAYVEDKAEKLARGELETEQASL